MTCFLQYMVAAKTRPVNRTLSPALFVQNHPILTKLHVHSSHSQRGYFLYTLEKHIFWLLLLEVGDRENKGRWLPKVSHGAQHQYSLSQSFCLKRQRKKGSVASIHLIQMKKKRKKKKVEDRLEERLEEETKGRALEKFYISLLDRVTRHTDIRPGLPWYTLVTRKPPWVGCRI